MRALLAQEESDQLCNFLGPTSPVYRRKSHIIDGRGSRGYRLYHGRVDGSSGKQSQLSPTRTKNSNMVKSRRCNAIDSDIPGAFLQSRAFRKANNAMLDLKTPRQQ